MRVIETFITLFLVLGGVICKNTTFSNEDTLNKQHALTYFWPIQSIWGFIGIKQINDCEDNSILK